MKQYILIVLAILGVMLLSGCTDTSEQETAEDDQEINVSDEGTTTPDENATGSEEIVPLDGVSVYSYLKENNYHGWSLWPGTKEMTSSSAVHGAFVTVYVSDAGLAAINGGAKEVPYGTIVVKDGFNENKELTATVVMYKVKGFDPEHNDWFWAAYTATGNVTNEGILSPCYNCHNKAVQSDYLFTLSK